MSHTVSQLRARRAEIVAEAHAILKHKRLGPAECEAFDQLMEEADSITGQLNTYEPRLDGRRAGRVWVSDEDSGGQVKAETTAFRNYLSHGLAGLSGDDKEIMQKRYRTDGIYAAQSVGTGSGGGFAVPDEMMQPIVSAMKTVGGVLELATVIPSATGADLPIPTTDETAQEGEIVNENTQHNEGDITLAQVVLQSFLYSSKIVRVSIQLMDDSSFPFADFVMQKLGERLGRITSKHWAIGDGASKPRGVFPAATVGKTAASATAVTYDELVDVMHSVDPVYRANGSWLMNDVSFSAIRKLKDSQQRPLYGDLSANAPSTLLGRPVAIDLNAPAMTTGQKSILFGDFRQYYIRLVKDVRVLRLDERYADFGQVGFLSFLRADGDLVDAGGGAIKALQQA